MKAESMSALFANVAEKLGPALLGPALLDRVTGELESHGNLQAEQLAELLGADEITSGWAMYQSGLKSRIEGAPAVHDESLGHLMAAEWCDAQGVSVTVRSESGGRYRWVRWVPGQGQEWLCDECRFRTPGGQAIKYLRLWSDNTDPHGAWRPVSAVFAGFESSGEQA